MVTSAYEFDDMKASIAATLSEEGFVVEEDKVLDEAVRWRPPLYVTRGDEKRAIDIRLNDTISDFWLGIYKETRETCPSTKIYVALPPDITIPYRLGKKLEELNVGIMQITDEGIAYQLVPGTDADRAAAETIRRVSTAHIDQTNLEDLEPYTSQIISAINIFEIGYPRDAVGTIGRVLETAIDDYLIEANRRHRIALSETRRNGMSFDGKIRFLASESGQSGRRRRRVITASQEAKMLSVKWDRNIADHPATDEEVREMVDHARPILEIGIGMIRIMTSKRRGLG